MISAKLPVNEQERLNYLKELKILDTAQERVYDEITELASGICDVPICLVSLIDENRQWFKSRHGLEIDSTPREIAFCSHAILQENVFEVEDTREDERFHNNPLVTGETKVIFYAGMPLISPNDLAVGTLCVLDHEPKKLNEFQAKALKVLAHQVATLFELRKNLIKLAESRATEAALAMAVSYAHEINNPLSVVTGSLAMFQDKRDLNCIDKIEKGLKEIEAIVNKITTTLAKEGIVLDDKYHPLKTLDLVNDKY